MTQVFRISADRETVVCTFSHKAKKVLAYSAPNENGPGVLLVDEPAAKVWSGIGEPQTYIPDRIQAYSVVSDQDGIITCGHGARCNRSRRAK